MNYYQPNIYAQQMPYQQPQINWSVVNTQNEQDARNYMLAPGNGAVLVKQDGGAIYLKSVDMFGNETFNSYSRDVTLPPQASQNVPPSNFVGRDEFNKLEAKTEEILSILRKQNANNKKTSQRKDVDTSVK